MTGIEEDIITIYELGKIQGEHNINWKDENVREEECNEYCAKILDICAKYPIKYSDNLEDYRNEDWEDETYLQDNMGSVVIGKTVDYIIDSVVDSGLYLNDFMNQVNDLKKELIMNPMVKSDYSNVRLKVRKEGIIDFIIE